MSQPRKTDVSRFLAVRRFPDSRQRHYPVSFCTDSVCDHKTQGLLLTQMLPNKDDQYQNQRQIDVREGYRKIDNTMSGFLGIERMLDFLTPKEYFYVVCKSYGIKKKEILARYNNINSFFNRKYMDEKKLICDYSNGNKQLIGIIAACLPYSDFVLLDEPFNYLDETTVTALVKMLDFLNKEKSISIVYSDNLKRTNLSSYESLTIENGNVQALTE